MILLLCIFATLVVLALIGSDLPPSARVLACIYAAGHEGCATYQAAPPVPAYECVSAEAPQDLLLSPFHEAETTFSAAKRMLLRNEGTRQSVYTDSAGNPTIGVGFNLTRSDADKRLREVGSGKAKIMAGEKLTAQQVDKLLVMDVSDAIADLVTLLPNFLELPLNAQLVLIDIRYNCGPAGLRTFVNTVKAIKTAQYRDAAARIAVSQWATQVGTRADRAVAMLRGIS